MLPFCRIAILVGVSQFLSSKIMMGMKKPRKRISDRGRNDQETKEKEKAG